MELLSEDGDCGDFLPLVGGEECEDMAFELFGVGGADLLCVTTEVLALFSWLF